MFFALERAGRCQAKITALPIYPYRIIRLTLQNGQRHQGKKVVAVLCFARPVALKELEPYCDAFLYTSHCGTAAGEVIADILYGVINPSGKLAMTMPRTTGQIPMYYNHFKAARYCNDYYSLGRSYKDIVRSQYPFWLRSSYTEFKLDNRALTARLLSFRYRRPVRPLKYERGLAIREM